MADPKNIADDFEKLLRDVFGEGINRLGDFQKSQMGRLNTRLQEFAREAVKDELARLGTEIAELRTRVAALEQERAETAADSIKPNF